MQEKIGAILFRWRNLLFPIIFILLFTISPASIWHDATIDAHFFWAGLAVALCGVLVRLLVASTYYVKRAGRDGSVHADTLYVGGPFALTRNPLYVGNVLIASGFLILLGNPVVIMSGVLITILAYQSIIATEERYLKTRFGEQYDNYQKIVPRWIPTLSRWKIAYLNIGFCWRRALAMEYSTAGAVVAGSIIMAIRLDITSGIQVPPVLWVLLAVTIATIAYVRNFKKAGRLQTQ